MDNVSFLGEFVIRDMGAMAAMPETNESGLWRAWQLEDGSFLVQALDIERAPWGLAYPLQGSEFTRLLMPLADLDALASLPDPEPDPNPSTPAPHAAALSPSAEALDLLTMWYEQAVTGSGAPVANTEPGPEHDAHISSGRSAARTKKPAAADEMLFTPAWHPDDVAPQVPDMHLAPARGHRAPDPLDAIISLEDLAAAGQAPMPPAALTAMPRTGAHSGTEAAVMPPVQPPPLHDSFAPPPTAAQQPPTTLRARPPVSQAGQTRPGRISEPLAFTVVSDMIDDPDEIDAPDLEARALQLEHSLRQEFSRLAEQLDERRNPSLELQISRLLAKGVGFTWKQKFMFTEFGLTLRRKRKPRLALESHQRALFFAPNDEHILFNVARSEFELGNIESAKEYLRKALTTAPDFTVARNFLKFLDGGDQEL